MASTASSSSARGRDPRGPLQQVTMVGFGAIGRSLLARIADHPQVSVTHVVVPAAHVEEAEAVDAAGGAFDAVRVFDAGAEHLVAALCHY